MGYDDCNHTFHGGSCPGVIKRYTGKMQGVIGFKGKPKPVERKRGKRRGKGMSLLAEILIAAGVLGAFIGLCVLIEYDDRKNGRIDPL